MSEIKKVSVGNFLNFPATQKFLEENLKENKKEFVSNLLAMVSSDANLGACDPNQLMMCAMNAVSLNLPLNKNLGYAYVIPYKGIPSFQIGYKGLIQLALRTGQYKFLNACEVRENEIQRNKFTGEVKFLGENEDGNIIGYVSILELTNGFKASFYMTEKEIEAHATRYSKMYAADKQYGKRVSKWSDPIERVKMAKKTVLKQLLGTWGVLSTEMKTALSNDDNNEPETIESSHTVVETVIVQSEPNFEEPQQGNVLL